jgi:L-threonylcarbamoyladenylate synthase
LRRHYSPKAKLWIFPWENENDLRRRVRELPSSARIHVIAHTHFPSPDGFDRVSLIPHDAEAFARAIYAELHQCDELGADCIIVEAVPTTNEWSAIADRLKRAATH